MAQNVCSCSYHRRVDIQSLYAASASTMFWAVEIYPAGSSLLWIGSSSSRDRTTARRTSPTSGVVASSFPDDVHLHIRCLLSIYLPANGQPDWSNIMSFLLQLYGIPRVWGDSRFRIPEVDLVDVYIWTVVLLEDDVYYDVTTVIWEHLLVVIKDIDYRCR